MNFLKKYNQHYIILNTSGKPIFSYHSYERDESSLALFALLVALYSKSQADYIEGKDNSKTLFLKIGELLFIYCGSTLQDESYLKFQLEVLHRHIVFHVTKPALDRLTLNKNYDLSALLHGTTLESRSLCDQFSISLSSTLCAIPVLSLKADTRRALVQNLDEARSNVGLFAFILGNDGTLVASVGPKRLSKTEPNKNAISIIDFLLLSNFIQSNPQVSTSGMETWTPICLPQYDDSGHFHLYCSNVMDGLYFLLLSPDASLEKFHLASKQRIDFEEKCKKELLLVKQNMLLRFSPEDFDASPAYHVVVRNQSLPHLAQYVETKKLSIGYPLDIFENKDHRKHVVGRYTRANCLLQTRNYFDASARDAIMVSLGNPGEVDVMCLLPPLTTPQTATQTVVKIRMFLAKNLSVLFIT